MTGNGKTIALWGHFADANLGDDACPTAVLHNLPRLLPEAKFVLICRFPHIAEANYGLPAFPVGRIPAGRTGPWQPPVIPAEARGPTGTTSTPSNWRAHLRRFPPLRAAVQLGRVAWQGLQNLGPESRFLWQSYRRLRNVDLLVVTGSGPIFDHYGGYWGFPVTVWKWATLARLAGTKLAFASVGAGPILSERSGKLLVRALRKAAYVCFRDQRSQRLMERHGYTGPSVVRPDLAHSLPLREGETRPADRARIGVNPMIVHNPVFWPGSDESIYQRYVGVMAALVLGLGRDGFEVFLYGTQKDDRVVSGDIQAAIQRADAGAKVPSFQIPPSVDALIQLSSSANLLVTTRYHGAVFGVLTATPTVAICYQEKTREVMEQAGIEQFAFEFEDVTANRLREAVNEAVERKEDITAALRRHAVVTRAQLDEQYNRLAELLRPE